MLCRNECGVLSRSHYFIPVLTDLARQFYYYTTECGHYFCEPGYCVNRSDAQTYILFFVRKGELAFKVSGKHLVASANEMVLLNAYAPHQYYAKSNVEFFWMHINGANSKSFCDAIVQEKGIYLTKQHHSEVQALLGQLIHSFHKQQIAEQMCSRMLFEMLCYLTTSTEKRSAQTAANTTSVERAIVYIQNRLHESISLGEIAEHVQISPYHFVRIFKKATGYSPYDYLILLRISHAKYLLKNTQMTIRAVGEQVGYHSEVSFIKMFSQKVGLSPGRFRKLQIA